MMSDLKKRKFCKIIFKFFDDLFFKEDLIKESDKLPNQIKNTLENGKNYDGSVIWSDENIDLSIIKIPGAALNHLILGESENIKLGEDVYAI